MLGVAVVAVVGIDVVAGRAQVIFLTTLLAVSLMSTTPLTASIASIPANTADVAAPPSPLKP